MPVVTWNGPYVDVTRLRFSAEFNEGCGTLPLPTRVLSGLCVYVVVISGLVRIVPRRPCGPFRRPLTPGLESKVGGLDTRHWSTARSEGSSPVDNTVGPD